jgi:hypothetical protein
MLIKIFIILFVLFAISRLILRFRDGSISLNELIIWGILWIIIIIITLLPWTADIIAKIIGVGRGVDALIYISIIFLFYGFFRISVKLEHIEYEITKIIRNDTLKKKR